MATLEQIQEMLIRFKDELNEKVDELKDRIEKMDKNQIETSA